MRKVKDDVNSKLKSAGDELDEPDDDDIEGKQHQWVTEHKRLKAAC